MFFFKFKIELGTRRTSQELFNPQWAQVTRRFRNASVISGHLDSALPPLVVMTDTKSAAKLLHFLSY